MSWLATRPAAVAVAIERGILPRDGPDEIR